QLQDRRGTDSLVSRGGDGLQQLQQGGALRHLLGKRGIEGLESFFLLAQGEILFLQQMLQTEFVDCVGDDVAQGASREIIFYYIVLYSTVHGLYGQLFCPLPCQYDYRIGEGDGLRLQGIEKLKPIHVRQIEVQYQAVWLGGLARAQAFFASSCLKKGIDPCAAQEMAIERAVHHAIVHTQDSQWRLRHHGDLLSGRVTTLNQYRISSSSAYLGKAESQQRECWAWSVLCLCLGVATQGNPGCSPHPYST